MDCEDGSKCRTEENEKRSFVQSDAESVSSVASSVSDRKKKRKKRNRPPCRNKQNEVFGADLTIGEIQLLQRDESKTLVELRARKHLFAKLLQKDDIGKNVMECLLELLAAISANGSDDTREFFRFLAKLQFIEVHMVVFTLQWRLCPCKSEDTTQKLISVLRSFIQHVPSTCGNVRLVAAMIQDAFRFGNIPIDGTHLQKSLGACREILSNKRQSFAKNQAGNLPRRTIFPTGGEVVDSDMPELRNIRHKDGPSVESYLDTHFQLRREDIVDPLRKVISEYHGVKRMKGVREAVKRCHVYTGVRKHEVITTHTSKGITVRVRIDISHLTNVNWETTKILSYGTLVCLTADHFHNMIFATIAKRDHHWLKKGFLDLRILRPEDMMALMSGKQFFLIDTQKYYEESYEVLEALQQLRTDSLPLAHHMVYLVGENELPFHLKKERNMKYDVGPLIKEEETTRRSAPRTWSTAVLDSEDWPSENLNVDEQQLKAIQAALTKQVTVITGSPGTGKTYVALKLTQLLLLNKHRLTKTSGTSSGQSDGGPLVFVCSTRATLDEFLAGVITFHRSGIVRCGGPYARKSLQAFNLERYREGYASETASKDKLSNEKLESCKQRLETIQANMDRLGQVIPHEEFVRPVIDPSHYDNLKSGTGASPGTVILEWLLAADVSERELDCLKEEVLFSVKRFTSREEDDGKWLEESCPVVLDLQSARLDPNKRDKIAKQLGSCDTLTAEKSSKPKDVWVLGPKERWQLYQVWLHELELRAKKRVEVVCKEMTNISEESQKAHRDVDVAIFKAASVIGMTSSSAVKCRRALQCANPKVVIIEEAADILQSTTSAVLPLDVQHLILIGENVQKVDQFQTVWRISQTHGIDASLMQHFIKNDYAVCRLQTQHRMSPTVSKMSRQLSGEDYESHSSAVDLPCINGLKHSVFFIEHNNQNSPATHEASFLLALFDYLIGKGFARNQISIITSFPAQQQLFQGKVNDRLLSVDNFRGGNDIVLFMCSGSERSSKPGCLLRDQRLLFVLTRARRGLYVIGNFVFLASQSPFWSRVLHEARRLEWVGPCMKLTCPYHPSNPVDVSTVEEFERHGEKNGCGQQCQARLECGHCCKEACHDHDLEKASIICNQPCNREICENGHTCTRLCSEPCETKCKGKAEKKLPCGHHQLLPCHLPPQHATCRDKCERILGCGHKCSGVCGKPCQMGKCVENTRKSDWPCGHSVDVRCCDGPETCPEPCGVILACDHPCSGSCGRCRRGRLHIVCDQPCGRTLVCGHSCESNCSAQCPPCPRRCENRCQHSDCRKICGETCIPCRESCLWRCAHVACPKLCGEPCLRNPCDEPCTKTLSCGHPCIGMCGEKCPTKCRICNKMEVTEILFGSEDEEDARFVELEDCGHVIEVAALDHYMNMSSDGDDDVNIQLKGCPKCKTPIRRNLRYGNVIRQTLSDVENVKTKIRGEQVEIDRKMKELKAKMAEIRRHAAYRDEFVDEEDLTNLQKGLTMLPHLGKVLARLNRCAFLRAIADIRTKSASRSFSVALSSRQNKLWQSLDELREEIVGGNLDRFTEQQMNDLQQESSRLNLQAQVITILQSNIPALPHNLKSRAVLSFDTLIAKNTPFTKDEEGRANQLVRQVKKSVGGVVLGISDQERVQIVRAIGLSQGHWYKCPQGHVYAIGECGGAMEQANCPECGASIGGGSHRLTSGNRVATEMDGARQAAWPMDYGQEYDDNDMADQGHHGMEFDQEDIEEQYEIERQIREDREQEERIAEERRERIRRERAVRELAERQRAERQRVERERAARELAERQREEYQRAVRERTERETAERERNRLAARERLRTAGFSQYQPFAADLNAEILMPRTLETRRQERDRPRAQQEKKTEDGKCSIS